MAKDWIQITKERVAQLATEVHDAELLGLALRFALRPALVRLELMLAPEVGGGRLQLQFLGVMALRSGELWKQNIFSGFEISAVSKLPDVEREVLLDDGAGPSSLVFTLPASIGIRLQVACESGWTRDSTR
jgi:hypothetical protein